MVGVVRELAKVAIEAQGSTDTSRVDEVPDMVTDGTGLAIETEQGVRNRTRDMFLREARAKQYYKESWTGHEEDRDERENNQ